jgi:hypothetical protein
MKTTAAIIAIAGMAAGTAQLATPPENSNGSAAKERLHDGESYNIGFLTLVGSPMEWDEQTIVTTGYLSPLPGAGWKLSLCPPGLFESPEQCTVGVQINDKAKREAMLQEAGKGGWLYCRVRGKFIMLSHGSTPLFAGSLDASSVVTLKRAPDPEAR